MPIQTNPSLIEIIGLDQLMAIAKSIKNCHYYYADSKARLLYGVNETPAVIKYQQIPISISLPIDLKFKLSNIDLDIVNQYKNFVSMTPDVFCPLLEDGSVQSNIGIDFRPLNSTEYLAMQTMMNTIYNFIAANERLSQIPSIFGNMESHPVVQDVISSKVTEGAKYIRLTGMNGKQYGFMIWRNLFSLSKGDTLTMKIFDRIEDGRLFQVLFVVNKKKSPIPTIIPHYIEQTFGMYINII